MRSRAGPSRVWPRHRTGGKNARPGNAPQAAPFSTPPRRRPACAPASGALSPCVHPARVPRPSLPASSPCRRPGQRPELVVKQRTRGSVPLTVTSVLHAQRGRAVTGARLGAGRAIIMACGRGCGRAAAVLLAVAAVFFCAVALPPAAAAAAGRGGSSGNWPLRLRLRGGTAAEGAVQHAAATEPGPAEGAPAGAEGEDESAAPDDRGELRAPYYDGVRVQCLFVHEDTCVARAPRTQACASACTPARTQRTRKCALEQGLRGPKLPKRSKRSEAKLN